jgi:hypothetical protein
MTEEEMFTTDHGIDNFTIKSYIITMMNNNNSVVGTRILLNSILNTMSQVQPFIMQATIPSTIDLDIKCNFSREYGESLYKNGKLNWTWPTSEALDGIDFATGLYKKYYGEKDWRTKAACTISHMRLWQHCIDINEPIMILEHDAIFRTPFKYRMIAMCGRKAGITKVGLDDTLSNKGEWTGGVCGLNSPVGTTRKANFFDTKVRESLGPLGKYISKVSGLVTVPYVDEIGDLPLPAGLAGNSAYIIKPWAAKKLLAKVLEVGLWPNDALMCRQFFPWLQVYYPYFTEVQNLPSTTK